MLHLTFRQLQVFESAARTLNFSLAAKQLYLSQPAVSMQIKQLEESIGLPLFEQMGKKIFLTEAGRELFHYSRNITQQLADMEAVFEEMKGLGKGKLTLAVVNTANYFTPQLLAKFCQRYPRINVILQVANRDAVLKQLADNSVDLAILGQPPDGLDISGIIPGQPAGGDIRTRPSARQTQTCQVHPSRRGDLFVAGTGLRNPQRDGARVRTTQDTAAHQHGNGDQ
jgi:DNA-binding transcriptional LysR family regulator